MRIPCALLLCQVFRLLFTAHLKLDNIKEALKDCTKAIELDPNYTKAHIRRGKVYVLLENFESAIQDFEKALVP